MRRCIRCQRHLLDESDRCPFCGALERVVHAAPVLLAGLTLVGCTDRTTADDGADGESTSTTTTTSTSTGATSTSTSATSGQTSSSSTGASTTDPDTSGTSMSTDDGESTTVASTGGPDDGSTGSTGTGTTFATSEDTAIPPYAGAFPGPDDEGQVEDEESTTG